MLHYQMLTPNIQPGGSLTNSRRQQSGKRQAEIVRNFKKWVSSVDYKSSTSYWDVEQKEFVDYTRDLEIDL